MMYFSKVTVMPSQLNRNEMIKMFAADSYNDHQLLWRLFDGDEQRQFIYRREQGSNEQDARLGHSNALPIFYLVSEDLPQSVSGLHAQSKAYDPQLTVGSQFAFNLRVNPTVAKRDPNKKHSARHDVLLLANREAKEAKLSQSQKAANIKQAADTWLLNRAEQYGFSLEPEAFMHDRHDVHRFVKAKSKHKVNVSSLDYHGLLQVEDVELFRQTLFKGLGRARGFGCGMMMIRKV